MSRSLQYLRDEYHDLSLSNSGVVDQLKALSRRLNKLSARHSKGDPSSRQANGCLMGGLEYYGRLP